MSIKTILQNKEDLASGEFYVFGTAKQWFLGDATGVLPFDASNVEMGSRGYRPKTGDLISGGFVIDYDGETPTVCGRVVPIERPVAPLMTLPYPALPKPELAQELNGYIHSLTYQPIREFINNLLMDEQGEIALGLVRARASRAHHHREEGGLLRHITEMVHAALEQDFFLNPNQYERELLVTAALVHDIGKADANILSRKRKARRKGDHKSIAKRIVAPLVKKMEAEHPAISRDMHTVFADILSTGETSRTRIGRMLQTLDRDSAFHDVYQQAFAEVPAHIGEADLDGRGGKGRTYRKVGHLYVIK